MKKLTGEGVEVAIEMIDLNHTPRQAIQCVDVLGGMVLVRAKTRRRSASANRFLYKEATPTQA